MNLYDRYVLPPLIDWACGLPVVQRERAQLVPRARGRVLEVGIGTGRNLPFYDRSRVDALSGVDPGLVAMRRRVLARAKEVGLPLELLPVSAESIPAASACFDTVLTTFTLCSIRDVHAALLEMRRVLDPKGTLLFLEHGAAPDEKVRVWQDRLTPGWKCLAGGCHLNRDVPALLAAAGFKVDELKTGYLSGPRPFTYVFAGAATQS